MQMEILYRIKQNPNLYQYLKYHSYWYKILNRNPHLLKEMEDEMKIELKLTPVDRINSFGQKIEMFRTFLDILK